MKDKMWKPFWLFTVVVLIVISGGIQRATAQTQPSNPFFNLGKIEPWPKFLGVAHSGSTIRFDVPFPLDWKYLARENFGPLDVENLSQKHLELLRRNSSIHDASSWLSFFAPPIPELLKQHYYFLTTTGIYEIDHIEAMRVEVIVFYELDRIGGSPVAARRGKGAVEMEFPTEAGEPAGGLMVVSRGRWQYEVTKLMNHDDGTSPMFFEFINDGRRFWKFRGVSLKDLVLKDEPLDNSYETERVANGIHKNVRGYLVTWPETSQAYIFVSATRDYGCLQYSYTLHKFDPEESEIDWFAGASYGCLNDV